MAKASKTRDDETLSTLPRWAQKLARRYFTQTVSTFLLYGAVRDLQPITQEDGSRTYGPLKNFLSEELFADRDHLLFYDRSSGIRTGSAETQKDLSRVMSAYDTLYGTDFSKQLPRDPGRALQVLENYLRMRVSEGKSVALIIDFAESIAPAAELGHLSGEDRFVLATLEKWSHDPQFLASNVSIVLVSEGLADISPRLSRNPYVATIELTLPDEAERLEYVRYKLEGKQFQNISDVPMPGLAQMTAGLSRINLDRVITEALEREVRITPELLKDKKKEIIQAECLGLLEFIEPAFNLDAVAGHGRAKERLRQAAQALKKGRIDVLPMGYLLSGPVGTGKTFLVTSFAGEIGIPVVKFLNFRSQWQGVTESNLEKIFNLLKALWPVAVMIDEADTFLGNRDSGGDSGTSARIFGAIASFMGNTQYRGKILWFLMTARPDLLPIDLKRQGRAEEHIALFYPQTDAEREELFRVMSKKTGITLDATGVVQTLPEGDRQISGADIEAVLVRAQFRALAAGRTEPTVEDLKAVLADFIPPTYPLEIELQNLAAVQECTSRELLPEAFRSLERDFITRRIRELKVLLEER